jgi:tetratricopeptide (TPR) repeat protein
LARHCTDAGLIEKASSLWGKAGQRSLARSALMEAETQLARALAQIVTLPSSPALRRDQITLQVALANAQMHTKGFAAPDTRASFDQARVLIERAETLGEPAEDPHVLYSVLYGFCVANYMAFKGDVVRAAAAEFLALAEKQGATVPLMVGHAVASIATSIAAYRSTGSTVLVPIYLSYLARAHADLGQFDDARGRLDEALAAVESSGERWCEADILRMAGEIELMSPERDERKAQSWFERSIEVAHAQQARSWELRAATSLARLWRDQGRSVEARNLLAPVYGWFTEGFDTLDLSEAKALLDGLAV